MRKDLRRWLRDLHERTHVTTLLVTHDGEEALEIADSVVVMRDGVVQQQDAPRRVYAEPANAFVMRFFGEVNALRRDDGTLYVRPGDFRIEREAFARSRPARVERVVDVGPRTVLELAGDDESRLTAELDAGERTRLDPRRGATLHLEPARSRSFEGAPA